MCIENLASHMTEKDTKMWQICIMVKKKLKKKNLTSSVVDLLHPECLVLLNYTRLAPYSNIFGYLWKVNDCLRIQVGIQKSFSPKFSYKKFTWYMDLTAVLVWNHNCWITGKETRCEKYFKVICLSMSSYFAQAFNSKIRRNLCKLLQSTINT